jgi:hypothetical protein
VSTPALAVAPALLVHSATRPTIIQHRECRKALKPNSTRRVGGIDGVIGDGPRTMMPLVCFSKRWGRAQAGGRPVHGREVRPVPLFRAAKLPPTFFDEGFRVRSNVDPASIFEPFSSYALRTLAITDWRPHTLHWVGI